MNRKMLVALGLALVLVPALPAVQASHSGTARFNPVEHDDQMRSNEPDFATTGVLGITVNNRVIDTDLDGVAVADSALPPTPAGQASVLAPGCTDDSGRRPSGLCGLWTVGAGTPNTGQLTPSKTLGVSGMSGNAAPGRFSANKATQVRFLDTLVHVQANSAGSVYLEVNKKLDDTGARAALISVDSDFGGNAILPGQVAIWPLYGKWIDLNGNGVIDHLGGTTEAMAPADNEFVWYGNCLAFGGAHNPLSITNRYCAKVNNANGGGASEMIGYIYPGNHHAICNVNAGVGSECVASPGDHPGKQIVAVALGVPLGNLDDYDANIGGDALLGPQDGIAPDQKFDDRTGDPNIGTRQWVYGLGWSTWFYDQSLLGTTVMVTAVNCAQDPGSRRAYLLGTCGSTDVDVYKTFSPEGEVLLTGAKATARSNWVIVRDNYDPLNGFVDGALNSKTLYDVQQSPLRGDLSARAQNPGWSREPNTAGDSFPGATFGSCTGEQRHNGFCNDYAGYASSAQAWTDVQPVRNLLYNRPVVITGSACTLCVAGPAQDFVSAFGADPLVGAPVRDSGDHRRSLGPGGYYFVGFMGLWKDNTQFRTEVVFDPLTLSSTPIPYVEPADGWVGSAVNATGAFLYRGFADEVCTTDKGTGLHRYAECHPYLDGNLLDPQQAGATSHGEWDADCDSTGLGVLRLTPDGGVWTVPVFVWNDHEQGIRQVAPTQSGIPLVNPGVLVDRTGSSGPIDIRLACRASQADTSGVYLGSDYLVLPAGNLGLGVTSSLTTVVEKPTGGFSTATDVDRYHAWGA